MVATEHVNRDTHAFQEAQTQHAMNKVKLEKACLHVGLSRTLKEGDVVMTSSQWYTGKSECYAYAREFDSENNFKRMRRVWIKR